VSAIELIGVSKNWADTIAVDNVSLVVEEGSFVVLLGPSGCGKSTTLRMIAGLDTASAGTIKIAGKDVTALPPALRKISMVFQSYALFPHLNVAENIIFGLKVRKIPADERLRRLEKVADIVGLTGLMDRRPSQLSGGQRQRVALARAIIAENGICLMDEPLSNLDAKLRHDMRVEIRALQQRLAMTVIYVTHDQAEAMSMADKVILLRDGRIEQEGTPEVLYGRPASLFTAGFIGTPPMNLLDLADGPNGAVIAGDSRGHVVLKGPGAGRVLGVRPEDISVCDTILHSDASGLVVELTAADYLGADTILSAPLGNQRVQIRVPGRFKLGGRNTVQLTWPKNAVHVFDKTSGAKIEGVIMTAGKVGNAA